MRRYLRFGLSLWISLTTASLHGQQRVTVTQTNVPGISLAAFDGARPAFSQFFADPARARVRPFSVVLTNATDKPITGLTVRWSWTDGAGKQRTHVVTTDSYFMSRAAVLSAKSEMLIGPGVLLPATLVARGSVGATTTQLDQEVNQFAQSSDVTLTLDTVILEDGSVYGPDQSQTLLSIYARKVAAESLVQMVQSARSSGKSPSAVFEEIASKGPTDRGDHVALWTMRLAGHLQRGDDMESFLTELARLATLNLRRMQ